MDKNLEEWLKIFTKEELLLYKKALSKVDEDLKAGKVIYPKREDIFNAFKYTPYNEVKAVILGQDPYFNKNQAMGLAFSIPETEKLTPSLRQLLKKLSQEYNYEMPNNGSLIKWAKEGVLLLNSILTVSEKDAMSHEKYGWEEFTDKVIEKLSENDEPIVFILLGHVAQKKEALINNEKNLIIKAPHPAFAHIHKAFWDISIYKDTNKFLLENEKTPINWKLN